MAAAIVPPLLGLPGCASAQETAIGMPVAPMAPSVDWLAIDRLAPPAPEFESLTDSIHWARARDAAANAKGRRIVVSLFDRRLWWIDGADTLFAAPVAIGRDTVIEYGEIRWEFETPRGKRTVLAKAENPVWIPPLWHYVEKAQETGRELVILEPGKDVTLYDGSRLTIRDRQVGQLLPNGVFLPVPPGEEIIFDNTVFVPPIGTINRRVPGELGAYKLDLGNGYLLHGTPHEKSIGTASTHGCIRLYDEDIAYLYENIPVGTRVFIY